MARKGIGWSEEGKVRGGGKEGEREESREGR